MSLTQEITFTNLLTINLTVLDQTLSNNFRAIAKRLSQLQGFRSKYQKPGTSTSTVKTLRQGQTKQLSKNTKTQTHERESTVDYSKRIQAIQGQLKNLISAMPKAQSQSKTTPAEKDHQTHQFSAIALDQSSFKKLIDQVSSLSKQVQNMKKQKNQPRPSQIPSAVESRADNSHSQPSSSQSTPNRVLQDLLRLKEQIMTQNKKQSQNLANIYRESQKKLKQLESNSNSDIDSNLVYKQLSQFVKKQDFQREKVLTSHRHGQLQKDIQYHSEHFTSQLQQMNNRIDQITQKLNKLQSSSNKNTQELADLRKQIIQANQIILISDPFTLNIQSQSDSVLPAHLAKLVEQGYQKNSLYGLRGRLDALQQLVNAQKQLNNNQFSQILDTDRDQKSFAKVSNDRSYTNDLRPQRTQKLEKVRVIQKIDGRSSQDLQKTLQKRIKQLKYEFGANLRELQRQLQNKQNKGGLRQSFSQLSNAVAQLKLMLSKKADGQSMRKLLNYLQGKLNNVMGFIMAAQSQKDGLAAKRGWTCLSCDKSLDQYSGKLGDHLVWERLPGSSQQPSVIKERQKAKSFLEKKLQGKLNKTLPMIRK